MSHPIVPVILSGGAGARLWPLSREQYPKQFLALLNETTLLQATARRLSSLDGPCAPIVVCNDEHRFVVAQQMGEIGVSASAIVLEPVARNTAPAIAAAALEALAQCDSDDDPILLVLPSDHAVENTARFAEAVRIAIVEAERGSLVAFGVIPAYPETGYGYIIAGRGGEAVRGVRQVEKFHEKPDARTAAALIATGNCYWNSGMFVFGARAFLQELDLHAASIHRAVGKAHENATADLGFLRLDAAFFGQSPALSVDCAVMELTSNALVVPLDAGWRDIGSWTSLADLGKRDEAGNAIRGDVVVHGTRNTLIFGGSRLMAAIGAKDLVIVDTADAVLVADRHSVQGVKEVVQRLKQAGRDEHKQHRRVHRPWGSYDSVHDGAGFNVKHIVVQPGGRLSLQAHRHRAEHWIVVRGVARVTRDDETFAVHENQSTYIPQGARHRLENPGDVPLELIEVQTGSYFGEDDIVRFEDAYGRADDPPEPASSGSAQ